MGARINGRCALAVAGVIAITAAVTGGEAPVPGGSASDQLRDVEEAFAATMADRNHAAFVAFLDAEVVFFGGDTELRGRQAVAEAWAPYFEGEQAPFSWRPEVVSVLDSGGLGLTSGPVLDRDGNRVGTFNSIWRRDGDGRWKIVFDRGCQ